MTRRRGSQRAIDRRNGSGRPLGHPRSQTERATSPRAVIPAQDEPPAGHEPKRRESASPQPPMRVETPSITRLAWANSCHSAERDGPSHIAGSELSDPRERMMSWLSRRGHHSSPASPVTKSSVWITGAFPWAAESRAAKRLFPAPPRPSTAIRRVPEPRRIHLASAA